MKKLRLLLFFTVILFSHNVIAQEEIYDNPVRIIDTTYNESDNRKETSSQSPEEKDDAITEMEKKKEKLNRLRIGGNFGLQFGNYTYINLSPTVGYMLAKNRLELGGGPIFIYQRFRYSNIFGNYSINLFVYGADAYARGFLYKGLFLEARYDIVNKTSYFDLSKKVWVNHLLLGAGYAAPIGKIGVFNISVLYNVLDNRESIYQGTFSDRVPIIVNMGFGFGIGGR